ncbi:MAG: DUF983 domain-containing protein [Marinicaulis sp.]|nr:DUF983 domain-containing protein [Marinicaulis sp.]
MTYYPPVSPYSVGMACKCPRCGQGALYDGFLKLDERCETCGLDYAKADSGDGPAVFVIFIAGFFAVALAFIARYVWYAPMWAAFAISAGSVIVLCLALLRPLKATMIALQYVNTAAEGRLEE